MNSYIRHCVVEAERIAVLLRGMIPLLLKERLFDVETLLYSEILGGRMTLMWLGKHRHVLILYTWEEIWLFLFLSSLVRVFENMLFQYKFLIFRINERHKRIYICVCVCFAMKKLFVKTQPNVNVHGTIPYKAVPSGMVPRRRDSPDQSRTVPLNSMNANVPHRSNLFLVLVLGKPGPN